MSAILMRRRWPARVRPSKARPTGRSIRANAQHIGYNPTDVSVPPLTFRWEHILISGPISPVAIVGNRVIATPGNPVSRIPTVPTFGALTSETGDTLWWGCFGGRAWEMSQATYESGLVYAAMCLTYFYVAAVDPKTVTLVDFALSRTDSHSLAATVYQGRVFNAGNTYGGMHAFDALTGEKLWRIKIRRRG